ncbi:MAG: hypothetical protein F4Z00_12485 [Acidimicrobiaceae bacterium]|nr:hypothetical protein [Acidimicrobiaceae bacterium]MXY08934.1 hypothetical protein [Acidimicrobiaceae bacterium]MXZ66344.1 hypothetical protein [Acidimicrobiaceae bacterium]MYF35154.1 hypothetical protein [Acidimicrobiaceae bacterium]MYJ84180.1 hypothetical protein [Acidimicrobiaceae bacterium]
MAMLKRRSGRTSPNQLGSGTAIGVAIIFPMLMLLIVCLQMLSEAARIEQGIQAAANSAARTASLCCYRAGGPDGAVEVARASLRAAETANTYNQVLCNNDFVGSSQVVFIDVSGRDVPTGADSSGNYRPVPPGGTVHVFVTCVIPPQILGGFGIPGLDAERTAEGVATVDPYRFRSGA